MRKFRLGDDSYSELKRNDKDDDLASRRQIPDRRKRPTPPISKYTLRGRRMRARRGEENENYYVDRYESRYLFVILGVILMSLADAYLTLHLLQHGGIELNPIMLFFIRKDPTLFLVIKLSITSVGILFLLIHKNFHLFGNLKVCRIIYLVFFIYFVLILYEIYLFLTRIPRTG